MASLSQLTFYLGSGVFRMLPPLALCKDRAPWWKYFARMFSAVVVVQNSFRRFALSSSVKRLVFVKSLPSVTGRYGSCQGATKWIKSITARAT